MTSTYRELPDGSAILTEMLPDGTVREVRLPPPFVVDLGPRWTTREDSEAIQRYEDRITELDRSER